MRKFADDEERFVVVVVDVLLFRRVKEELRRMVSLALEASLGCPLRELLTLELRTDWLVLDFFCEDGGCGG